MRPDLCDYHADCCARMPTPTCVPVLVALLMSWLPRASAQGEPTLSPGLLRGIAAETRRALSVEPPRQPALPPRIGPDTSPITLGWDGGTSALYCPHFLPKLYPGKNLDQMCREDFFTSPWLFQTPTQNPFVTERDELQRLWDDADVRRKRLPWALAFAALNRDCDDWESAAVIGLLRPTKYLRDEVVADAIVGPVYPRLPASLGQVSVQPGEVAVDVRVQTNTSYDSVACTERLLLSAAERGMKSVVVCDRARVDGAQAAERAAERLKREGRLPAEFRVLPGQLVEATAGSVLALFASDVIPGGMTLR